MKEPTKLSIKGMVCNRCIMAVNSELNSLGYVTESIQLGEVRFKPGIDIDLNTIEKKLEQLGFRLLEDRKAKMIKEVKQMVEEVYCGDYSFPEKFRFSHLVQKRLNYTYELVSDTFIALEKTCIERYIIDYRIGKVKEFLVYTNLTLSDIAFKLNFTGTSHLSAHFKQVTGLTPSFFKEIKRKKIGVTLSANSMLK